jgi:hypothetical protein
MSIDTVAFIAGGLFIAVAILGGGIEIHELKIPSVGRTSRLLSFTAGIGLMCLAIFLSGASKLIPLDSGHTKDWLTSDEYQQAFDERVKNGYYPVSVKGRCAGDVEQFHVEWKGRPIDAGFASFHAMTKDLYEQKNQEYSAQGYSQEFETTFKDCSGQERYQATWLKMK